MADESSIAGNEVCEASLFSTSSEEEDDDESQGFRTHQPDDDEEYYMVFVDSDDDDEDNEAGGAAESNAAPPIGVPMEEEEEVGGEDDDMEDEAVDAGTPSSSSSGGSKRRRRFTAAQKCWLVKAVEKKMREAAMSQRNACEHFNIDGKQYRMWKKQFAKLSAPRSNRKAKSLCAGRELNLKSIEDDLLRFIFELREQGMGVTIKSVMLKACSLDRKF